MALPEITHVQFLLLSILMEAERNGRYVRAKLKEEGVLKTGPAFYQLMSRLEDLEFVDGRYEEKTVEGHRIKERWYRLTESGRKAWENTRDFYLAQSKLTPKLA